MQPGRYGQRTSSDPSSPISTTKSWMARAQAKRDGFTRREYNIVVLGAGMGDVYVPTSSNFLQCRKRSWLNHVVAAASFLRYRWSWKELLDRYAQFLGSAHYLQLC
jgi:hypothetical protein